MVPRIVSVEWEHGTPRRDPEEAPVLHSFPKVEGLDGSPLRLGGGVVNQLCLRTMPTTVTWFDGARGAPQPQLQHVIDTYRSRHPGEDWQSVCFDWLAGSGPESFWASFYVPYKYGHAVEAVLERWKKGQLVGARTIKRRRRFGLPWSMQRTLTVVEHASLTVDYQVVPGTVRRPTHYHLEALGDLGPIHPVPLEHRVMRRCHDGSFGSRLVDLGAAAALSSGEVFVVGHDCTREKLPAAVEWWSATSPKSRFELVPGDPAGRPVLSAARRDDVWLGYGEQVPVSDSTYLLHFDGASWTRVPAPFRGIASLAQGPDKTLWVANDQREVWRRRADGQWLRVDAPSAQAVLVARGWAEPKPLELWLWGSGYWRRLY